MFDLQSYLPQAEQIASVIDSLLLDELHLMAPQSYELSARGGRVYLIGTFNPMVMGRSMRVYEHPEVARRLRLATGKPVAITKDTGTRYVVLVHGALGLPKLVEFPTGPHKSDVFRLGVGLKGEICVPVRSLGNVMIGAAQGVGKSNVLELLTGQMLSFGWRLYLADPQSHTFNPDVWNRRAAMAVAGSHEDMVKVLYAIEEELATRVARFRMHAQAGKVPADVDEFNQLDGVEKLPRLGFVIDEANYFLGNKAIFHRVADLLRQGRKWGLHIVVAAHEWHKENVPAAVNDLLRTRIALAGLSGAVVLRSHQWGKWVENRPPGRGVLRMNGYQPMQFYRVGDTIVLDEHQAGDVCPIPAGELVLIRRAMTEVEGKMSIELLMQWGLSDSEARELTARYDRLGWLAKDKVRSNARYVTEGLRSLMAKWDTNPQAQQTPQTADIPAQTQPEPIPDAFSWDTSHC